MADFQINAPLNLEAEIRALGDRLDEIAPKMLNEAAPILAAEIYRNAPGEIRQFASVMSQSKPKKASGGGYITTLGFKGKAPNRKDGLSMNALFAYWEYGSTKNPPTGFIRKSVENASSKVQDKMTEVLERELNK